MVRTDVCRKPVMIALALFLTVNFGLVLGAGLPWVSGVTNPTPRVDLAVYGIYNANFTGVSVAVYGYLRNVPSQLVHSNFRLNSNSCASCHLTHQAPGENQLFQRSIYNTCSSCHFDDANSTYNVLTGHVRPGGPATVGGRFFDGDFAAQVSGRRGVSFHLATGAVRHRDAPGANTARPGFWDNHFTCGSCHAPHSSYSGRALHFNVNGQAPRFGPVALETVAGEVYLVPSAHRERTPWLHYDPEHPLAATHGVVITNVYSALVTHAFRVQNQLGQVTLVDAAAAGAGPYHVSWSQTTLTGIEVLNAGTVTETVYYRSAVANFCASCHTVYRSLSPADPLAAAFYARHAGFEHPIATDIGPHVVSGFVYAPPARFRLEESGGQRRLTCLSCHFAHGTDTALMTRSDMTTAAYGTGDHPPPETRLSRFGSPLHGNREVCLACHAVMPAATLTVLSTVPAHSSTVSAPADVRINFDRRVDMNTVSSVTLTVYGQVYGTISGAFSQVNDFRTVVFTPGTTLRPDLYTVNVTNGVRSWFARPATPHAFNFTVQ
jgi:predicted CXXCH cytochrome family protein